ncbi:MAG: FtsX-like permease family protein [Lachnospiraceae bacterium]|nr:FtsX-like permease family protein [Lachnospiraceae bacterium]
MLGKLSLRNMKRSAKDYMVYVLTMTIVVALMYAFNSLIFQNELSEYFEVVDLMAVMLGLATVFIVLIVAWLINYMVRFILEKRSREFGIYLLLGMKRKMISRLYMQENVLLGGVAFLLGMLAGVLLQQVLLAVMYAMLQQEYRLHVSFHANTILMTVLLYMGCYLLALLRCKRKFRKMNISGLMNAERQNQEIREKYEPAKRVLFPLSLLFLAMFWLWFDHLSSVWEIVIFLVGLVLTIYLFYLGISAWLICYVRKGGSRIYWGQNLFLIRQFASKIRTMQFTFGTLTALFTLALMGTSVSFMFNDYENTVLQGKFPFDVQVYSADTTDDFADERAVIDRYVEGSTYYAYSIYTDGKNRANGWILTHLRNWGTMYQNPDGTPNWPLIEEMLLEENTYYRQDTYMALSDYNALRRLLGYEEKSLEQGRYLLQVKPRLLEEVLEAGVDLELEGLTEEGALTCGEVIGDPFSQDGHNGADYLLVVSDEAAAGMQPYYAEMVAQLPKEAPKGLRRELDDLVREPEEKFALFPSGDLCCGSDNIVSYAAVNLVRRELILEVKYMLSSIVIPMFYIGLVFVCVAVTVLSVQQLSDSAKYRFRYEVLLKLGMGRAARSRLIFKQLAAYYLCPAMLAILISGKMILFMSGQFVAMTGVPAGSGKFFLQSILLFFGIYLVYFAVTYVGFLRNVEGT